MIQMPQALLTEVSAPMVGKQCEWFLCFHTKEVLDRIAAPLRKSSMRKDKQDKIIEEFKLGDLPVP